ncbi:hypothetical protein F5X68DRAFT_273665 [Plectosphaerella plurivora]|uniref:Uncharacterized protein n=1 Tax=Plectosphaerella plurivora TaxID=936078 RepID=A0A9P8VIL7_9PEZI|nr:hypothetical protein F5X68DRAFT_273665 [Plectosphaerella plurivora]
MLSRFASGFTAFAILASGVSAQSLSFGPMDESNASPNATNTVTFEPGTTNDQMTTEWTWRVNVSSVAVSANISLQDPHVVETTWDMSFGDQPNLASAVQNVTAVCAAVIVRTNWPLNVTRNFDTDSGSCNTVLGSDCVSAIIAKSMWDSTTESCSVTPELIDIPACRDTLLNGDASLYMALGDLLPGDVESGQGIARTTSAIHAGSESAERYEEALNDMQLSVIEFVTVGSGQTYTALQAVCNRVNRGGKVDEEDGNDKDEGSTGGNNGNNNGGGSEDDGSGAQSDGAWTVGVLAFGAAAAMAAMF